MFEVMCFKLCGYRIFSKTSNRDKGNLCSKATSERRP